MEPLVWVFLEMMSESVGVVCSSSDFLFFQDTNPWKPKRLIEHSGDQDCSVNILLGNKLLHVPLTWTQGQIRDLWRYNSEAAWTDTGTLSSWMESSLGCDFFPTVTCRDVLRHAEHRKHGSYIDPKSGKRRGRAPNADCKDVMWHGKATSSLKCYYLPANFPSTCTKPYLEVFLPLWTEKTKDMHWHLVDGLNVIWIHN